MGDRNQARPGAFERWYDVVSLRIVSWHENKYMRGIRENMRFQVYGTAGFHELNSPKWVNKIPRNHRAFEEVHEGYLG